MAIERSIDVGGRGIRMRASALIPRIYRAKFGRDLITDMRTLQKSFQAAKEDEDTQLGVNDLTIFENVAWLMARAADPTIPAEPDDWLDSIDGVFSVYEVLPEILALWGEGLQTTSTQRKK